MTQLTLKWTICTMKFSVYPCKALKSDDLARSCVEDGINARIGIESPGGKPSIAGYVVKFTWYDFCSQEKKMVQCLLATI